MKDQISVGIKRKRMKVIGELNIKNAEERNASLVGKTVDVIYEDIDYDRNMFVGRTEADAPEIDGLVYFTGDFCDVGNVYKVKIVGYDGYDLIGEKA